MTGNTAGIAPGPQKAVAYIDLLGFGQTIKTDLASGLGMLEDCATILESALANDRLHPATSYPTNELRRIAERNGVSSFLDFLPMSDGAFVVSDNPSLLVFQLSSFLVRCYDLKGGQYAYPQDPGNPRRVRTVTYHIATGEEAAQDTWQPVLFRGGVTFGEVHQFGLPGIVDRKHAALPNVAGRAVVDAVKLEELRLKGPIVLCTPAFACQLDDAAKEYVQEVTVKGVPHWELCWPLAIFEDANGLEDGLNNRFGEFLCGALNLLVPQLLGEHAKYYDGLVQVAVRSALKRFPAGGPLLAQRIRHFLMECRADMINGLLGTVVDRASKLELCGDQRGQTMIDC